MLLDSGPDDPRLVALADRMTAFLVRAAEQYGATTAEPDLGPEVVALLDELFLETVPAAPRLLQLLRQRGWDGWTQIRPAP